MPEVIFVGPEGRLEGRYQPGAGDSAPIALVLHAHPKAGGSMDDPIVTELFDMFRARGFATLRFNFRGVGRSQGVYDQGIGELSDAAAALDWVQSFNANAPFCWVAGYSFGAWIGMQLLMRRPEIWGFISVSPPTNHYDFTFLAPCPASGVIIHGEADAIVSPEEMERALAKVRTQKTFEITKRIVPGAGHLFSHHLEALEREMTDYLDARLAVLNAPRLEAASAKEAGKDKSG